MMKIFTNLNSNNLVVTYVSSYRPEPPGLTLDLLYGQDGFNIHSLMPSEYKHTRKGVTVQGIRTTKGFDMKHLNCPQVKPALEEELKKYWRSLRKWSFQKNLKMQANKHLKYHQLGSNEDIFEVGLVLGKELVSEEGKQFLMRFLEEFNYRAGQIYSCRKFADDLENEIGGVKVTFLPHPNGHAWNVKYLHEIHVLYTKDAKHRILDIRKQSFKADDVFLLEDLRVRRESTLFTPTNY
ncbi:hypothetical protein POM88_005077 [Heracleum sosnowskyi]|uniref:Uncharacterized protein n=1 Tax=Heracleum sosnowskyi TaxID=360622 RepID=A0AAD8JJ84_9APIA|nr:hypothetical protein POM88_005077 [Heracleum sosnowskyi]